LSALRELCAMREISIKDCFLDYQVPLIGLLIWQAPSPPISSVSRRTRCASGFLNLSNPAGGLIS
jgi:hypothetical protein